MSISSGIGEMPGARQIDAAINNMNRKLGAYAWNGFKRGLATTSDPLFRKQLGERYFTRGLASGGSVIWLMALILSCWSGSLFHGRLSNMVRGNNEIVTMENYSMYSGQTNMRQQSKLPPYALPLFAGLVMMICHAAACSANFAFIAKIRAEGKLYHSMSRGVSRFGDATEICLVLSSLALLLLAPFVGLVLVVSKAMSFLAEQKQQEMLWDAYLDQIDQKIESEYLKPAMLGEVDPSITFLAKPLDQKLDPELRKSIANAVAGEPVEIVARKPQIPENQV